MINDVSLFLTARDGDRSRGREARPGTHFYSLSRPQVNHSHFLGIALEFRIKGWLSVPGPAHLYRFIGEESYAGGERPDLTDAPTWIVDPIDGTT